MDSEVLCPELAEKRVIITANTISDLSLSNYARSPGTVVNIKCLSNRTHTLIGPSTITCLKTGQWNKAIPECLYKTEETYVPGVVFADEIEGELAQTDIYVLLPYIVSLAVLGVACVSLVALLAYVIHRLGRQGTHEPGFIGDTGRSSTSHASVGQTEYWVEMATSCDSLRHDMSVT